jgi:hypothetical protein
MTIRHVRQGQAHVDRQREIVAKLAADGHSTSKARDLLATFEHTPALHRQHLDRLRKRRSWFTVIERSVHQPG